MAGTIGILNVGAGDTKLVFDRNNPAECIRAARIVRDMLRRGYALLVETGEADKDGRPIYRRATDFDENTCEYIIADFDPVMAAQADEDEADADTPAAPRPEGRTKKGRPKGSFRLDAAKTKAVAVAHTAGG